ncbi:MAG: membrane protein insertion efficiency factor YidD [Verrucomicrobiae bacterium]|nr:membrane protein insertion efficiency factor YidD [Verrucomicrobiae bacterium]MCP5522843.1 membrane protein insertion efficiency factor YidD [Verrucomicrobiales bacterium]
MNAAQHLLVFVVRAYQLVISPAKNAVFGPLARCRFEPTCSQYAREAVCQHGALRGSWLAVCRLCRCHPWGGAGYDPVPPSAADRQDRCCAESGSLPGRLAGGR